MNVFQSCSDTSDATPLSASQGLYLKPVARLHMSVQLPTLKTPGKSISNWEVMEKLRHYASPDEFTSLKVSKSTLEVVRFEGEIENRSKIPAVLARLDGRSIKLSGFRESLKVRAVEAKPDFPTRHSWDQYFRDAKNMNEMKPGERPDTIHIMNLPCKWFATKLDSAKPNEFVLRRVFGVFGELRCVDIPSLDPFRSQMKSYISGIKMFSNNQNMIFEAYVQYKEYIHFVKAMDALRGMKLVYKDINGKAMSASIKVDFDTSKHLSESFIRRRKIEREILMEKEQEKEEKEKKAREEEAQKLAKERKRLEEEKAAKLERQRQREERRKQKQMERLTRQEADEMNQKIATEERLLLEAQRRLESFRLLGELFNRLKMAKENQFNMYKDEVSYRKHRDRLKNQKQDKGENVSLEVKEKELRDKLVKKFKTIDDSERKSGFITPILEDNQDYNNDFDNYQDDNSEFEHQNHNFNGNRNFRAGSRGGRRNWNRGGRRGMNFRGYAQSSFGAMPFQPFPNRGFFPHRGFPRWPRFPPRGRGDGGFGFMPPFIDPLYLEAAMSDPYYKYFQKLTRGNRDKKSYSRSRSRSRSRSCSRYRSHSRSRSRSSSYSRHSRSRSRSYSRSKSRSKTRSRSRSHHRGRKKRRSRSRSSSRRRSRSHKRTRSYSSHLSKKEEKDKSDDKIIESKTPEKTDNKVPSVHSWSKSPSKARSDSWENRKDEPSSSTKPHKHKKKKKEKKKNKKKDHD